MRVSRVVFAKTEQWCLSTIATRSPIPYFSYLLPSSSGSLLCEESAIVSYVLSQRGLALKQNFYILL